MVPDHHSPNRTEGFPDSRQISSSALKHSDVRPKIVKSIGSPQYSGGKTWLLRPQTTRFLSGSHPSILLIQNNYTLGRQLLPASDELIANKKTSTVARMYSTFLCLFSRLNYPECHFGGTHPLFRLLPLCALPTTPKTPSSHIFCFSRPKYCLFSVLLNHRYILAG